MERAELEAMTVEQLKQLIDQQGLTPPANALKADLVDTLVVAQTKTKERTPGGLLW